MRALLMASIVLGLSVGLARADDKVTEKDLVGKWSMKLVGGKNPSKVDRTIEFTADGKYVRIEDGKIFDEGSYKVDGTSLKFTRKGEVTAIEQKELKMNDGKISWRINNTKTRYELTRIDKDK